MLQMKKQINPSDIKTYTCIVCKEDFDYHYRKSYCNACASKIQKTKYRINKTELGLNKKMGRKPYPLKPNEAKKRFLERMNIIKHMDREEWKKFIKMNMDKLLNEEEDIWNWCVRNHSK